MHIVQAIVGHTNVAMTGHYFHVSDDALQGAVAVLPDVFRPVAALPAHKADDAAAEAVGDEEVEVVETVPASVAKVARMLIGCSPEILAQAERQLAALLAAGGRGGTPAASGALDASTAILDGMRGMVDALAGMTADNWKAKRDRALAIAAAAQKGMEEVNK